MKKAAFAALAAALLLVIASCASTGPSGAGGAAAGGAAAGSDTEREYAGAGRDPSLLGAQNKAKMDAVKKAVIDMIGKANEEANRDALDSVLYSTKNPNAFVINDTFNATRRDKAGEDYVVEATVKVRLDAVQSTLKANGLLNGEKAVTGGKAEAAASDSKASTEAAARKLDAAPAAEEATPEEQKIIRDYVEHMTYMVYFAEKAGVDAFYMKAAVGIANEYLASNTMETIDQSQIEKLKGDQQKAYEAETGESISMLQWIAQKLSADIYIEIDAITTAETTGGKHYGQANITLKAFEASTARLVASTPWNSPKTMSTSNQQSAVINALQTSVYKAMPTAIGQSKAYMAKALTGGIKFDLVVQKTPDSKVINDFRRKLRAKVKDVKVVSQTDEETKLQVYLIGSLEDLVDLVDTVAETVSGLEGMRQILLRGKSITYHSGM